MVRGLRSPLWIGIALAALAGCVLLLATDGFAVRDEFGRNLALTTSLSLFRSLALALLMSAVALVPPIAVAYFAAEARTNAPERIAYAATRVLDTIPLFLWIAITYSALGLYGNLGRLAAITIVSFPFTLGLILERFVEVAKAPFSKNGRALGAPSIGRLLHVFVPNAAPSLRYPLIVVFGASVTFDAVIGLLGMGTRSELSLGALLWRVRERAAIDSPLVIATILSLAVATAIFVAASSALASRMGRGTKAASR